MGQIFKRALQLPDITRHSVFLWGPRKSGKTYWIKENLGFLPIIDLLKTDIFAQFAARPSLLRERYGNSPTASAVVIDEVQKLPALLDEVHWMIENTPVRFLLTGSSARKLRRTHANLLGGRAWRREMRPLCFPEMNSLDIEQIVLTGLLPAHLLSENPIEDLRSYVADYLTEEVVAEGTVRNLPAFSEFLRIAALTSAEILNYTNIARDVGVSAKVINGYFDILQDTLLGFRLSPWRKTRSRKMTATDKFYLFDVGVSNFLARRKPTVGTPEFGKSFEQYILMELTAYRAYRDPELDLHYWRTNSGLEVDFVLNDKEVALEIKTSSRIHDRDIKGLTALAEDSPVGRRIIVSFDTEMRIIRDRIDKIEIMPWKMFLELLWGGQIYNA